MFDANVWGTVAEWVSGIATVFAIVVVFIQMKFERKYERKVDDLKKVVQIEENNLKILNSLVIEVFNNYEKLVKITNYPHKENEQIIFMIRNRNYEIMGNIHLSEAICKIYNIDYMNQFSNISFYLETYLELPKLVSVVDRDKEMSELIGKLEEVRFNTIKNIQNVTEELSTKQ